MNKRGSAGLKVLIVLLVIAVIGFIGYKGPYQTWKQNTIRNEIKEQAVSKASELTGLNEEQIEDILSVIPSEDQDRIVEIVSDHVNPVTIVKAGQYVKNRDAAGLAEYAESQLTPEEESTVLQIAANNAENVEQKLSEYGIDENAAAAMLQNLTDAVK